ncbi:MAG: FAD-binding domain-containing protein [Pseudomonadota bacterium]
MAPVQVVWFKRDLRVCDHAPLHDAARNGPVLAIVGVEPNYWAGADTSARQYNWWAACARALGNDIGALGGRLHVQTGDICEAFDQIAERRGLFTLHAHEETGNRWTYERDIRVRAWCKKNEVTFHEHRQYGILRGSALNRDRWAKDWDAFMERPAKPMPSMPSSDRNWVEDEGFSNVVPSPDELGLTPDPVEWMPEPGTAAAREVLQSFLYERGRDYRTDMSSPTLAATGGSRLSPHLAVGTISMRECYQTTLARQAELKGDNSADAKAWRSSLRSFVGRLHWHCHFIQKLEADPQLEWRPAVRAYEGMRPPSDPELLDAFAKGQTGFPFVDACMRQLAATGWINFRMRAMLMSFACYDLFLRWQDAGMVLARLFTDYEPGIHWTQAQMQSGESGINTLRIYNPIKQGRDHDADGDYIRQWVPELRGCDAKEVHEPWKHECGTDYRAPLVDHAAAIKAARDTIWHLRKRPEVKAEAQKVLEIHGSRKRPSTRRRRPFTEGTSANPLPKYARPHRGMEGPRKPP